MNPRASPGPITPQAAGNVPLEGIQQDSTTRWWDSAGRSVYLKMDGQDVLIVIASDDSVISSALPALS